MNVVTLPVHLKCHSAVSFDVWVIYSDRIFLGDLCTERNGYASIAIAADEVSRHCLVQYGSKRIIYCKTIGWQWRELIHEQGVFSGLAPYGEAIPLKVIGAWLFGGLGPRRANS